MAYGQQEELGEWTAVSQKQSSSCHWCLWEDKVAEEPLGKSKGQSPEHYALSCIFFISHPGDRFVLD